ncbi:MAG TPA: hypothetical protein VH025_07250 [Solirubrobacteraceae bacterium]|nr:hypothetical protein [Solirubrobacteraceae bacterium]
MSETDVLIKAGHTYEVMHDERRWATAGLARELRGLGLNVDLEITEYVPGRRGLGLVEWTEMYIGMKVADSLISAITGDVYEKTKTMLRDRMAAKKRRRKGKSGRKMGFKIYGPNGDEIQSWTTKEDDEGSGED